MILVKRSSPPRSPADSTPTAFFTVSLVGPVMMRPRESVLTAVVKKRRLKGASGCGSRILRSKGADSVAWACLALAWNNCNAKTKQTANPTMMHLSNLFILRLQKYSCDDAGHPPECLARSCE